nr:hypothetical protein GCM10020092_046390 [Actinoplanes digitatis]
MSPANWRASSLPVLACWKVAEPSVTVDQSPPDFDQEPVPPLKSSLNRVAARAVPASPMVRARASRLAPVAAAVLARCFRCMIPPWGDGVFYHFPHGPIHIYDIQ